MAVLAALDISQIYKTTNTVYTFGACRVGNKEFAEFYEKVLPRTYRLVHYADLLAHLPTNRTEYVHAGW